jgi:spore germination protein YaaH
MPKPRISPHSPARGVVAVSWVPALVAAAVALTVFVLAANEEKAAAAACKGKAPSDLKVMRSYKRMSARLHWGRPRRGPARARYRVYRDGRVVGQTTHRSMLVRVSLGRRHTFSVRTVSRSGHVSRCRAVIERAVNFGAPGRPRKLAVGRVTDRRATLSWFRAHRGMGRLAGYRIIRDGKTVRQVKRRRASIRLASAGRYRIRIRAVDTHGQVGPASNTVTVRTSHRPPGPPRGVQAVAVTDTMVGLVWSPAVARSRKVVAYRIFRNGVPLRQVPATSFQVTNLAPVTGYSFSVAAVDSIGHLSPESTPLSVMTAMPPPTNGRVHAFLLASTDQSFVDFRAHYNQIGTLYPTYFDCRADASIIGKDDPLVTGWAKLRKVQVLPRLNCQNEQTLTQILTNSATRARWLDAIVSLVEQHGYDGINLDFEKGNEGIRAAYTSFVSTLASRLHARGKKVSLEVSAKRYDSQTGRAAFYDYRGLAAVADYVFVMNWGLHWAVSGPGAIDDLPWARDVADYVARMPNKRKFVLGTAMYGYDWPNGGGANNRATALEYSEIQQLIARVGAKPRFDPTAYAWTFSYREPNGTPHEVWFGDAASINARIRLAQARGLGIGFWRLGSEDQRIWDNDMIAPGTAWP